MSIAYLFYLIFRELFNAEYRQSQATQEALDGYRPSIEAMAQVAAIVDSRRKVGMNA